MRESVSDVHGTSDATARIHPSPTLYVVGSLGVGARFTVRVGGDITADINIPMRAPAKK